MERNSVDLWIEEILKKGGITTVLDIGTGDLIDALACAEAGAKVDAVDIKPIPSTFIKNNGITYYETDVALWLSTDHPKKYNLVILRSVLHYLSPPFVFETLIPKIGLLVDHGGFVYVLLTAPPPDSDRFAHSADKITAAFEEARFVLEKQERATNDTIFAVRLLYRKK